MKESIAKFLLFLVSFGPIFIEINNEGAFCHFWRNFQRNPRINGFEVALEVSRIVNMLRRNLIANNWPHEENAKEGHYKPWKVGSSNEEELRLEYNDNVHRVSKFTIVVNLALEFSIFFFNWFLPVQHPTYKENKRSVVILILENSYILQGV